MRRWLRRKSPSRTELIERKHRLEGEIAALRNEIRRRETSGRSVGDAPARLQLLQDQHLRTRLEIDRSA